MNGLLNTESPSPSGTIKGLKIGSVVIDCDNFEKMAAFWREALGYVPGRPAEGGWVLLKDPGGSGSNLGVNLKTGPLMGKKTPGWHLSGKIRLHLDLYASDQEAEVQRLLSLGARLIRRPEKGEDYVILADPEDNHFCVIQA